MAGKMNVGGFECENDNCRSKFELIYYNHKKVLFCPFCNYKVKIRSPKHFERKIINFKGDKK